MNKLLDLTKPVYTKDGKPARIICTDANCNQPIVTLVKNDDGTEFLSTYTKEGHFYTHKESDYDLINVTRKSLIDRFESLQALAQATVDDLRKVKGVGRDKAVTLVAAFALAQKMAMELQEEL